MKNEKLPEESNPLVRIKCVRPGCQVSLLTKFPKGRGCPECEGDMEEVESKI